MWQLAAAQDPTADQHYKACQQSADRGRFGRTFTTNKLLHALNLEWNSSSNSIVVAAAIAVVPFSVPEQASDAFFIQKLILKLQQHRAVWLLRMLVSQTQLFRKQALAKLL